MSTKATLKINIPWIESEDSLLEAEDRDPDCPYFHLYEEAFEEDGSVYLQMTNAEFEVSNHGIMLKIPAKVWNRIIKIGERHAAAES